MLSFNISDIATITVKNVYYHCIIHNISKSEAINLLKNFVFEDRGYISKNAVLNFNSFYAVSFYFFCFVYVKWLTLWTSQLWVSL